MIRLALIGAGVWGQNLLRIALERNVLAAVVDPEKQALDRVAQRAPQVPCFPTFGALLHSGISLDAAVIASPARTHGALAAAALEAGLDLLVEKPLTVQSAEATALVRRAQQTRRVAMVGHLLRYHPAIERMLAEVHRGVIGVPIKFLSWRRSPPGRSSDVEALWALAPHDLSLLLALDSGPLVVRSARLSSEQASVRLETSAGFSTQLHLSRCHPVKERCLVLWGTEGALLFDDLNPAAPLRLQRFDGRQWQEDGVPLAIDPAEPLARELEHFLHCVSVRGTPRTPFSDGAQVVRWLEAIEAACPRSPCLREDSLP
ncbi:MAG: Gfo/Idh/MocA family oxidoreductase [Myxococcales bacterium]|nr:Gfo/Idh/MocA family oxidoreductase [Polyangiaceae bacterium]MDW8250007.1 Gfo/Idh/MocA family oxidoreductase [Myxococcales bacterium]